MSIAVEHVAAPTRDARTLIGELDAELNADYPPEQRHGFSVERVFQPDVLFFIARDDAGPVACGAVALQADGMAEVKRMYVRPRARGCDVARAILDRLEAEARSRGASRLVLETGDIRHAAIRFYERRLHSLRSVRHVRRHAGGGHRAQRVLREADRVMPARRQRRRRGREAKASAPQGTGPRYNARMSVSCVGTCSDCGVQRFWLSDTLSLQTDDGVLQCLPHPAEGRVCEREYGLTLAQASDRGRLYRETFFVCRHCGRDGETMEKHVARNVETFSVRGAMRWGWGSALVVVPLLAWMRWWQAVAVIGGTLVASPGIYWWENRKIAKALAARGLPRPDAPGVLPIPAPAARNDTVVGRVLADTGREIRATGPCCDKPDWIEAYRVKDGHRVPCCACGAGVMVVSDHAIH